MVKPRCQSCGIPLGEFRDPKTNKETNNFGTEANGSRAEEWCRFCYHKGAFTKSDITLDDMMKLSIDNMVTDLGMPEERAIRLANEIIPRLKRWREEE